MSLPVADLGWHSGGYGKGPTGLGSLSLFPLAPWGAHPAALLRQSHEVYPTSRGPESFYTPPMSTSLLLAFTPPRSQLHPPLHPAHGAVLSSGTLDVIYQGLPLAVSSCGLGWERLCTTTSTLFNPSGLDFLICKVGASPTCLQGL